MDQHCLIVDDHQLYAEAVESVLSNANPTLHCTRVGGLKQAASELKKDTDVSIVILDLCLPDASGLLGLLELRGLAPKTPILIHSAYGDRELVQSALICGAAGYVPKTADRKSLLTAARDCLAGRLVVPAGNRPVDLSQRLTHQQMRILEMICQGLLNKQIAHRLGIYETTVKAHASEIIRKFDVLSRTQAVLKIVRPCTMLSIGCRHGLSLIGQRTVQREAVVKQALNVP